MRANSSAPSERGVSRRETAFTARVERNTAAKGSPTARSGLMRAFVASNTFVRLSAVFTTSQPMMI